MAKYIYSSIGLQGYRQHPLDFSVSGQYIIDVDNSLPVIPSDDPTLSSSDLITLKTQAYQRKYPQFGNIENDEFLDLGSSVDQTESDLFAFGTLKKTRMFPGGSIVTDPIVIGSVITEVFTHWYGFLLHQDTGSVAPNPEPNRVLYNYNSILSDFEEFDPSTFTAEIRNSTNTATLLTLTSDTIQPLVFGPGSIRLRFTNTHPTLTYGISDWVLMF